MKKVFEGLLLLGGSLYAAILLLWFLLQPVPELQDFLEWVFQGWAFLRLLLKDPHLSSRYSLLHTPVPNMLAQLSISAFSILFGPFTAAKLLITAYVVLGTLVCSRLARRFAPTAPAPVFIFLLGVAVFNACFWHGYINYQISLLLVLLYIEVTFDSQPSPWLILVFSLLLYCCHASMFAAFLLLVILREWKRPDRLAVLAALLPATALLIFYLIVRSGHQHAHGVVTSSLASHLVYKGYTLAKAGPFHNLVIANGASAVRLPILYRLGVGANFLFAICLLLMVAVSGRQLLRSKRMNAESWIYSGVLALLFLLLPSDLAEVVNLGERFLYLLAIMIVLEVGTSRFLPVLAWLSIFGFVLTLAQIPGASLPGPGAPEAFHQPPGHEGRAYAGDGLFSHRLYQNDERRIELRDHKTAYEPLLFDTGMLENRK